MRAVLIAALFAKDHDHTPDNRPDPANHWKKQLGQTDQDISKIVVYQTSDDCTHAKE
jgi:hypothetical protein